MERILNTKRLFLVGILFLGGCASTDIYSVADKTADNYKCGFPIVIGQISPIEDQGALESAVKGSFKLSGINASTGLELFSPARELSAEEKAIAILKSDADCVLNISQRENSTLERMNFDASLVQVSTGSRLWIGGLNTTLVLESMFADKKVMFGSVGKQITNTLANENLLSKDYQRFVGSWKLVAGNEASDAAWNFSDDGQIRIHDNGGFIFGYFNVLGGNILVINATKLVEADGSITEIATRLPEFAFIFISDSEIRACGTKPEDELQCVSFFKNTN